MTGLLSQALANVEATEKTITSLSGLPAAAEPIVQQSSQLIQSMAKSIRDLQAATAAAIPKIETNLNDADAALKAGKPLPEVKQIIDAANAEAQSLQTQADAVSTEIGDDRNTIDGYANQLAGIENDIGNEIAKLNGQLGDLKSKRDAAKKKYYWLLALGPFGLAGLAAALALYLKFKHDVDDLESEISAKQKQIDQQKALVTATKTLNGDFNTLVTKVSGVKNAVGFLASDIGEVVTDLEHDGSRAVIELYIQAALSEAKEVAADAA